MTTQTFHVENMKCGGCVAAVKEALEKLPGVEAVEVDLAGAQATVRGDVDAQAVVEALKAAGYPATPQG